MIFSRYFFTLLIMFVSPVFSLVNGLSHSSFHFKRWVLTLFITFYGSIIFITDTNDGYEHLRNVQTHYQDLSFSQFADELKGIIIFEPKRSTSDDVFIHTLSYFVGGILGAPQLFFVFVSFIYGYFFSGALLKVLEHASIREFRWLFFGFLVVFVLWKNIEGINTVRTWTGLWVLFYGALSYYQTRRRKYLLLIFMAPLFHVAYFIMALPAWFVLVFGSRPWIYAIIYTLSFITTFVDQSTVISQFTITQLGQEKISGYYVGDEVDIYKVTRPNEEQSTWYRKLYANDLQDVAMNLIAFGLILFGVYAKHMNEVETRLFSTGILTVALANMTWFIFALSNRSAVVGGLFIIASFILFWKRNDFMTHTLLRRLTLWLSLLLFLPFVLFRMIDLTYFISVFLIAFPFISWIDADANISIRQALGKLL